MSDQSSLQVDSYNSITLDLSSSGDKWVTMQDPTGLSWMNDTITIGDWQPSPVMEVKGEDADIRINGMSVRDTLRGIQEQLNLLQPDPEMEREWDELRAIRKQYEAKLEECREKSQAWNALKHSG